MPHGHHRVFCYKDAYGATAPVFNASLEPSMKRLILPLFAGLILGACASSPDIPEDGQGAQYRSTNLEETSEDSDSEAAQESAEPGMDAQPVAPEATGPIATVNGNEIPADDFNIEIQRVVASGMPPTLAARYKDTIVQKLVDRYLIDAALAESDITVKPEEIDEKLEEVKNEFAQSMQASGQNVTLDMLVQQLGITEKELRESVEQSIGIEKMLFNRGMEEPSDEEARAFYDENREESFTMPEQVHVKHVLIAVEQGSDDAVWQEAKKRADAVRADAVKDDADFEELARTRSEGPSAEQGGDLGFVPRGKTVPEFENAAFDLKPGEISEPVKSPFGWHVIKLIERKDAEAVDYDEIAERLKLQLKGERIKESLDAYLTELRDAAEIEIHSENVN